MTQPMIALQECLAHLPETVGSALQAALAELPGGRQALIKNPENQGALNHVLLLHTQHGKAVFRMRRQASAQEIFDYLNAMYVYTGFPQLGGIFRLRDIQGEIAFQRHALELGLPVPDLLCDGGDWMLIEFIEGRTAYAAVKQGDLSVVSSVLKTLHEAHEKGVIYGDRWGDNEVIDPHGQVRPIDFDVEWNMREPRAGFLEAMEMGVYLFNTLRLTSDRPALLALAERQLLQTLRGWGYEMALIADVVDGLARFYLHPDKPGNEWSLPISLYQQLQQPVATLVERLRQAA